MRGREVIELAKNAAAPQPQRKLRVVAPRPSIEEAPVLSFEDALHLYIGLLEQSHALDQHLQVIRQELLRAMERLGITSVREEDFEVIRQVRHRGPRLDTEEAEALLERFGRLKECLVPQLDEDKARKVLDELKDTGKIAEAELPYEYPPESEVLVVRRAS